MTVLIRVVGLLSCLMPGFLLAQSPSWYSLKAFLPAYNGSQVQLQIEGVLQDKAVVKNDVYSFTGTVSSGKTAVLVLTKNRKTSFLHFFIEPGTIKIRDEGRKLVAFGTPSNDEWEQVNSRFDSLTRLQSFSYDGYEAYKRQLVKDYLQAQPNSIVSLQMLFDHYYRVAKADDTVYYQLYQQLPAALQQSYLGKKMAEEARWRFETAVGRKAPFFTLPDTAGNPTSLFAPGKITLVNFWASWCVPCRKEHPVLKRIFNKYQSAGFTIVGVSLDESKAAWFNAIQKEKLTWLQVSDGKGWQSAVIKKYGVQLIPMNFLLDAQGMILAKNLTTELLETQLASLFPQ